MQLTLNGDVIALMPIRYFRETHALPETFGIVLFEPKDTTGRGSIESAGQALNRLKATMLAAIPMHLKRETLLDTVPTLTQQFREELTAANDSIGLSDEEIEFAVAGFSDVLQTWVYELIRWRGDSVAPEFNETYQHWHQQSVRLSQRIHEYTHRSNTWRVQIINDAYGRIGLRVELDPQTVEYIHDESLACPAAGYMYVLLSTLAVRLKQQLMRPSP